MECPCCHGNATKVLESRSVREGIRRRRECLDCGNRLTTIELIAYQGSPGGNLSVNKTLKQTYAPEIDELEEILQAISEIASAALYQRSSSVSPSDSDSPVSDR